MNGLRALGRLARREPIGVFGFLILFVWSIVAVGAIGSGAGWLGVGRYDPDETFQKLNLDFVHLKAAAALDGAPADIAPNQIRELLAPPEIYGPFAAAAGVQGAIQDYLRPLIAEGDLLPLLAAGRSPFVERSGGTIHAVDRGFAAAANRPLIVDALRAPSWPHWFGTDRAGHDIYALIIDSAWRTLYIGFLAALIGVACGLPLALAARPVRGTRIGDSASAVIGSVLDGLLALPPLILLVLAVFGHGSRDFAIILPLAAIALPLVWRVFHQADGGAPRSARSMLPALIAVFRNVMLAAIISEAALSFVGFSWGWGALAALGRQDILEAPWQTLIAGLAIASLLVGVYATAHGLGHLSAARTSQAQ